MIGPYFKIIPPELKRQIYSSSVFYGFERDLSEPLIIHDPHIKLSLRRFQPSDAQALVQPELSMTAETIREYAIRGKMLRADIQTCYVTVTKKGTPCHMQWMIGPKENEKLQALTRGGLPIIADNEVLLENVFTLAPYRKMGIELWTVKRLFQMALESGARRAILFVNRNNRQSLKMVLRMGFTPYLIKTDNYRWFSRKRAFKSIGNRNIRLHY